MSESHLSPANRLESLRQPSAVSRPHTPGEGKDTARPVVCVFCGSSAGKSPAHLAAARSLAHALHKHNVLLVYGAGTTGIMGELASTLVSLGGPEAVYGVIPAALIQYEQSTRFRSSASSSASEEPDLKRPRTEGNGEVVNGGTGLRSEGSGGAGGGDTGKQESAISNGDTNKIDEQIYGRTTVVADMHTRKKLMAKRVIEGGPGSGFIALSGGYGTLDELMEITTWNQLGIHGKGVVLYNVEGYYDGLIQWLRSAVDAGFISQGNSGIIVESKDAEGCLEALKEYQCAEGRMKLDWTQN